MTMRQRIFCGLMLLVALGAVAGDKPHPGLLEPSLCQDKAPETFRVAFKTTKGDFNLTVHRAWSPYGADRFYNLVKIGYFKDIPVYRMVSGFVAQFGFHGDPAVNAAWATQTIKDDSGGEVNLPGRITFAKRGAPNSRATQFFINLVDNRNLDRMGFTPFGEIEGDGLAVVKSFYSGYGEQGPSQFRLEKEGLAYVKAQFPQLDYITSVTILE